MAHIPVSSLMTPVDDSSSPTRHRPNQRPSFFTAVDSDVHGVVHPSSNGYPTTTPHHLEDNKGWNAYDEKRSLGLSWLADPVTTHSWSNNGKAWWEASPMFILSTLRQYVPFNDHLRRRSLTAPKPTSTMFKFCLLCCLWYSSSALSSNTGKAILNQFRYPVTLTFVQFGFVASYCLLFSSPLVRFTRLRRPSRAIFRTTLPMGLFQVGGHMFSSMAISRIPVSTVHTIKALSPLFTVAAYAILFRVSYSPQTYISLLPLTIGVMLACTFDMSASNVLGLSCAFGSAVVFVSSNIFFKKIMPGPTNGGGPSQIPAHKLDKLNLLFYSSSMAFLLMIPIWIYYDLPLLLTRDVHIVHPSHGHSAPHGVVYYFIINGSVHFAQNIIAFVILSSTSPVTYSIASLIKRVAVICIAIVWFNQSVHPVQGLGICLTFLGLWMYNNAKADVQKGENKMRRVEAAKEMILPTTKADHRMMDPTASPAISPTQVIEAPMGQAVLSVTSSYGRPVYAPQPSTQSHPFNPSPYHLRHAHSHPSAHLKIVPPSRMPKIGHPSKDSYPSPPPSHDSPPSSSIPLV